MIRKSSKLGVHLSAVLRAPTPQADMPKGAGGDNAAVAVEAEANRASSGAFPHPSDFGEEAVQGEGTEFADVAWVTTGIAKEAPFGRAGHTTPPPKGLATTGGPPLGRMSHVMSRAVVMLGAWLRPETGNSGRRNCS
jgi:hypothetical protein